MPTSTNGVYIGSKIAGILKVRIEHAVDNGIYLNISDFVRDAVKEKLRREGFMNEKTPTEENIQQV